MGIGNSDIEKSLEELPDQIASALEWWRKATLDREKCEALLYLREKGLDKERSATEIKALVHSDDLRYSRVLDEIKAEAEYNRLYESLMAAKKRADLRTAF
jgi:hypothetical protein